jgi:hypothetical protein
LPAKSRFTAAESNATPEQNNAAKTCVTPPRVALSLPRCPSPACWPGW